jgi:hypothetical protein
VVPTEKADAKKNKPHKPKMLARQRNKRRFPPSWSIDDIGAAFVVKDSAGQRLACL